MIKLTYDDLSILSECVLYRINEMYKARASFSGFPNTLEKIDDGIEKLRRLNVRVSQIMTKIAQEQRTQ